MRKEHLSYIIDPKMKQPLEMVVFKHKDDHVIDGLLLGNVMWYPIINGVPRLLLGELKDNLLKRYYGFFDQYKEDMEKASLMAAQEWQKVLDHSQTLNSFLKHQQSTADSFSYEWDNIYRENNYERDNFLHFVGPYIEANDFKGLETVDIGCGSGRFTKQAALLGVKVAFGVDLGDTVEVAYRLNSNLKNVCIVQGDIYNLPFAHSFDLVYSIGVLHHLPNPQMGFDRVTKLAKDGGRILIWVYSRRNNARALYFYEPLRAITRRLPHPLLYKLCYAPAAAVHAINKTGEALKKLGATEVAERLPFSYYTNFPFNMKLNDAFDVLATPKSNYYFLEEIVDWFESAGLRGVQAHEHKEAGITAIGTRQ